MSTVVDIFAGTMVAIGLAGALYSQYMLNKHHRKDKK